ncbi:MAG: acetoin utilization protein AcuC [Candidatus Latescibacteria bacterium]|nr:acetoin utilization protein AcuC [Candidatus Latescibacterota bacterium]
MRSAFIHTDVHKDYDYGAWHPLKLVRYSLTYELIRAYGLLDLPWVSVVEPEPAREEEILTFHTPGYVEALRTANSGLPFAGAGWYGLGVGGDNPIFKGVYDLSLLSAGGSIRAARMVDDGEVDVAFFIGGGLHHALEDRASGFCYFNDPVLAIYELLRRGRRVVYIDIDAHHGDGVQQAFYHTDRVLTISIHETGRTLFPGTGFETETGAGQGEGYAVNMPLLPGTDDEVFVHAFEEVVPPLIEAFKPDRFVTQLGIDTLRLDPLTHLDLTTNGFIRLVERIRDMAIGKWVAVGGGGYNLSNVVRGWTLAWAVMNGVDLPDDLPESLRGVIEKHSIEETALRDRPYISRDQEKAMKDAERVIGYLKEMVFPLMNQTV